jgi:conjugal transfer pilus assembly protein TraV
MPRSITITRRYRYVSAITLIAFVPLTGCSTVGSLMVPYSEKFSCKNPDHGQCIHPEQAYEDAVAGRTPRSDPAVTRDKALLQDGVMAMPAAMAPKSDGKPVAGGYAGYRDSLYRELQGLIDQPETPMLKPVQAVRTLVLPYADRQRPDRLYMPRYVYSILERPSWVVGGYLVSPVSPASQMPVLGQLRERADETIDPAPAATPAPAREPQP